MPWLPNISAQFDILVHRCQSTEQASPAESLLFMWHLRTFPNAPYRPVPTVHYARLWGNLASLDLQDKQLTDVARNKLR